MTKQPSLISPASLPFYLVMQRGAETALVYLSKFINAKHPSKSSSSSSALPCEVVVLLLAPCHSFPGFGLLSELIERTGCTVELYSPDCSPISSSSSTPSTHSADSERFLNSSIALTSSSFLSESKRFEADPAVFVDPHGSFSSSWTGASYVLTFNSYIDDLWPALHSEGFGLVIL